MNPDPDLERRLTHLFTARADQLQSATTTAQVAALDSRRRRALRTVLPLGVAAAVIGGVLVVHASLNSGSTVPGVRTGQEPVATVGCDPGDPTRLPPSTVTRTVDPASGTPEYAEPPSVAPTGTVDPAAATPVVSDTPTSLAPSRPPPSRRRPW